MTILRPLPSLVLLSHRCVGLVPSRGEALGRHRRQQACQRIVHLPRQRVAYHDDFPPLHAPASIEFPLSSQTALCLVLPHAPYTWKNSYFTAVPQLRYRAE